MLCVGWANVVVATTRYGLDVPGIKSRCLRHFPYPFRKIEAILLRSLHGLKAPKSKDSTEVAFVSDKGISNRS